MSTAKPGETHSPTDLEQARRDAALLKKLEEAGAVEVEYDEDEFWLGVLGGAPEKPPAKPAKD